MKRREKSITISDPSALPEGNPTPPQTEESPPAYWEPIPECLAAWTGSLLYWVTAAGGQFYANVVAPLGLRPHQVAVLQVLASEGPMVQARVSERTRIDKATMVGLLNDLEAQGLIRRSPSPCDRRAFDVSILEAGRERLRRVEEVSLTADRRFFGALSEHEQEMLRGLLRRLATHAGMASLQKEKERP